MKETLITALYYLFEIIQYAIFARILVSWLPIPRDNMLIRLLYQITEPILGPIRAIIQRSSFGRNMMLDFSPIVAFLIIRLIMYLVIRLAY